MGSPLRGIHFAGGDTSSEHHPVGSVHAGDSNPSGRLISQPVYRSMWALETRVL